MLNAGKNMSKLNPPGNDDERRKQADARRPMIMRRILISGMDDPLDLDKLNTDDASLRNIVTHQEPTSGKESSDGRSGIEKDGRRRN
jgi:hypothetical protein